MPPNLGGFFMVRSYYPSFFFFNDTATTEIYTLSLHDALPISGVGTSVRSDAARPAFPCEPSSRGSPWRTRDRKSTRLNSSHSQISYAVFCLKKKTILWFVLITLLNVTLIILTLSVSRLLNLLL